MLRNLYDSWLIKMSGGFLAVQAKRSAAQRKKINLGRDSIENVVKYVWSIQSVTPAVQNVGPVGWC